MNILLNVLVPVLALTHLSKDPAFLDEPKFWHIGPMWALIVALALPLGYGIWFFLKTKKGNFFSFLGLFSVLLTGGLTLFLWKEDGSVDSSAPVLFGLKEASIPFVLGLAVLVSHWTKSPLLRVFLYNDQIFDLKRIETKVAETESDADYQQLLFRCTLIFSGSFLISTVLNFILAQYFLGGDKIDYDAENARELYNAGVGKITFWGFIVIGVPIFGMLFVCLNYLISSLKKITGLTTEEVLLPR